jgi:outer membrane biosynthesis protein TonB
VINSKIDPELAHAAVEAVSKWRYSPTLLNGEPIEVDTTILVNFKLLPSSDLRSQLR